MQAAKVPLNEYEFPTAKLANVQSQLEKLVAKNYYLHSSAREAYRSYLLAYNSHQLKEIFNVHLLDLLAVAKSFGFSAPPRVRLRTLKDPKLTMVEMTEVLLGPSTWQDDLADGHLGGGACWLPVKGLAVYARRACEGFWGWMMQKDRAKSETTSLENQLLYSYCLTPPAASTA